MVLLEPNPQGVWCGCAVGPGWGIKDAGQIGPGWQQPLNNKRFLKHKLNTGIGGAAQLQLHVAGVLGYMPGDRERQCAIAWQYKTEIIVRIVWEGLIVGVKAQWAIGRRRRVIVLSFVWAIEI